jgi:MOSC domain-containing protein YiiM
MRKLNVKLQAGKFFQAGDYVLEITQYANPANTCIRVVDAEGCPYVIATVNHQQVLLPVGMVLIKNWSENEGILEALVAAGIVRVCGTVSMSEYVSADVCMLLV